MTDDEVTFLEWNILDNAQEVINELCVGIQMLNKNQLLTFVASIIYEEGYDFKVLYKRIDEIDGAVFSLSEEEVLENHEDKDTE